MALSPATVTMYVVWNMTYAFGVGLSYAAFTAVVLSAMGAGSGATKYNMYASLANFPIWWLGLLLGVRGGALGRAEDAAHRGGARRHRRRAVHVHGGARAALEARRRGARVLRRYR